MIIYMGTAEWLAVISMLALALVLGYIGGYIVGYYYGYTKGRSTGYRSYAAKLNEQLDNWVRSHGR